MFTFNRREISLYWTWHTFFFSYRFQYDYVSDMLVSIDSLVERWVYRCLKNEGKKTKMTNKTSRHESLKNMRKYASDADDNLHFLSSYIYRHISIKMSVSLRSGVI